MATAAAVTDAMVWAVAAATTSQESVGVASEWEFGSSLVWVVVVTLALYALFRWSR